MTMTKFSRINKQREEITMRVLEDMEKGGNEWKKPWVEASPLPPHNPVSGTQYSGRNFLYTYVYGMMRGYADPRWATEKQIKEKCNVENRPIPEYENDRVLPLDYHKELLASLKEHFGCGESNYRTPDDLLAARSYGSYLSGISLKFNPQDVIAAVEHATETVQAELVPYLSDSFGPDRYLPCGCHVAVQMNNSIENAAQSIKELRDAGVDLDALPNLSCDECSQLAAKVIPYAENKAHRSLDRTLGHKHEVNRDVAQRMQTERTTVNQIREEDTVGE